jgi:drug/metabolite transporter (DMT)-like permease
MNRPLLGLLLGSLIGLFDGSTAFFTAPDMRDELLGIVLGSAFKGLLAGLLTGIVARKTGSLLAGVVIGLSAALLFAIPIAHMNAQHYSDPSIYWKIILPGAITGMTVGFGTVRFGRRASPSTSSTEA